MSSIVCHIVDSKQKTWPESKNRLAEIGFQTASGVQIAIDDKKVKIGMEGNFDEEYDFR